MYGKCVVTYTQFVDILNQAEELGLAHAPKAADIPDLTDGADIVLTLMEMGHEFSQFKAPYHHLIEAVVLFGDYGRFNVCVTDEVWKELPTLDQWWASRPKIVVSAEAFDMIQAELDAEDAAEESAGKTDEEGEEGGSGVREPLPDGSPAPTEAATRQPRKRAARKPKATEADAGEPVPLETPVG